MSETPRIDELVNERLGRRILLDPDYGREKLIIDLARQLERELELARAELLGTQKINAELRERCAELEKDAERYRWLRETLPMTIGQVLKWPYYPAQYDYNIFDAKIDAAIEAALKEPQ